VVLAAAGFLVTHRSKPVASVPDPVATVAPATAASSATEEPAAPAKPDIAPQNENPIWPARPPATNAATEASVLVPPIPTLKPAPPRVTRHDLSKPAPHPDCDPPYSVDSVGHRHYKVACL
jgi:hypothetical protein